MFPANTSTQIDFNYYPSYTLTPLDSALLQQVEYYFSFYNYSIDSFLQNLQDAEGWTAILDILTFPRMQMLHGGVFDQFGLSRLLHDFSPVVFVDLMNCRIRPSWIPFVVPTVMPIPYFVPLNPMNMAILTQEPFQEQLVNPGHANTSVLRGEEEHNLEAEEATDMKKCLQIVEISAVGKTVQLHDIKLIHETSRDSSITEGEPSENGSGAFKQQGMKLRGAGDSERANGRDQTNSTTQPVSLLQVHNSSLQKKEITKICPPDKARTLSASPLLKGNSPKGLIEHDKNGPISGMDSMVQGELKGGKNESAATYVDTYVGNSQSCRIQSPFPNNQSNGSPPEHRKCQSRKTVGTKSVHVSAQKKVISEISPPDSVHILSASLLSERKCSLRKGFLPSEKNEPIPGVNYTVQDERGGGNSKSIVSRVGYSKARSVPSNSLICLHRSQHRKHQSGKIEDSKSENGGWVKVNRTKARRNRRYMNADSHSRYRNGNYSF